MLLIELAVNFYLVIFRQIMPREHESHEDIFDMRPCRFVNAERADIRVDETVCRRAVQKFFGSRHRAQQKPCCMCVRRMKFNITLIQRHVMHDDNRAVFKVRQHNREVKKFAGCIMNRVKNHKVNVAADFVNDLRQVFAQIKLMFTPQG